MAAQFSEQAPTSKRRKVTGKACAVAECTGRHSDGISLHKFPKNPQQRQQWTDFVRTCRADFGPNFGTPNDNSFICEKHFTSDAYPLKLRLSAEFGIPKLKTLNHGAVPTIQKHLHSSSRKLTVTVNKDNSRPTTSGSCSTATVTTACSSATTTATTVHSSPIPSALPGVSTVRGAYAKRERKRVIADLLLNNTSGSDRDDYGTTELVEEPSQTADASVQTEVSLIVETVLPERIDKQKKRSRGVQVYPEIRHKEVQTFPFKTHSKGIQYEESDTRTSIKATVQAELAVLEPSSELSEPWQDDDLDEDFKHEEKLEDSLSDSSDVEEEMEERFTTNKALRLFHHLGVAAVSAETFYTHQKAYLHPAIESEWKRFQDVYINQAKERGEKLTLGGDGRADSPGHCAKYGLYTTMDLDFMMVVDVQLKQSNQVGGSVHMEKQSLLSSIAFIKSHGLDIREIVSDRHPMIIAHVRDHLKGVKHSIDVWHVAKGLKKKLLKLAAHKECEGLAKWIKSIINHLYWVPASTCQAGDDNGALMVTKWKSLENHLHNKHHHREPLFPECNHPPLDENDRKKKWIKPGSRLSAEVGEVLNSRQMLKDVAMLSTSPQTASIEGFHSVLNHFAPKMFGFSFNGMHQRAKLAALHYNCNSNREQATAKDGSLQFNLSFKKGRKEFHIQEIKVGFDYCYVDNLMRHVTEHAKRQSITEHLALLQQQDEEGAQGEEVPPPLCSAYDKPEKAEAVKKLLHRFNVPDAVVNDIRQKCKESFS